MAPRASIVLLFFALFAVAVLARPDVDVCTADLEKSRAKEMVWPREITSLCVLADRGFLGTDVDDCFKKLSEGVLGRRIADVDAVYVCDAIRGVVARYLASH